jgi:hypothetical protein
VQLELFSFMTSVGAKHLIALADGLTNFTVSFITTFANYLNLFISFSVLTDLISGLIVFEVKL